MSVNPLTFGRIAVSLAKAFPSFHLSNTLARWDAVALRQAVTLSHSLKAATQQHAVQERAVNSKSLPMQAGIATSFAVASQFREPANEQISSSAPGLARHANRFCGQWQTFTGNLYLTTQAEVDAFNYVEVTGSLTISGNDIVDLSPLSVLNSVGTYLSISDNTALTVVDGFDNLTDVGWGIYVWQNTSLVSFAGFDALLQTGDNIDFWYNDSLVSVSGFSSLHTVGWSLEFGGHPFLTSIPRFESLEFIASSLFILDNPSLPSITGFNSLLYVDWSFQITGNSSLKDLCGFYDYFSLSGSYTGGGAFDINTNHPDLPDPTTIQDVLDAGPCDIKRIDALTLEIQGMGLPNGTTNSLVKSLEKAKKSLENGKDATARDQLEALIDDIIALERRGKIDAATSDYLVAAVTEIIAVINF